MSVLETFFRYALPYECENEDETTHFVRAFTSDDSSEDKNYNIPQRDLSVFLEHASSILSHALVSERVPVNTPAFFSFKFPFDDDNNHLSDELLALLVNLGLRALTSAGADGTNKSAIILRSPPYLRPLTSKEKEKKKKGKEIERPQIVSVIVLYPRIIVQRDTPAGSKENILTKARNTLKKAYNDYFRYSATDNDDDDDADGNGTTKKYYLIEDVLHMEDVEYLPIYGATSKKTILSRRFYCGFSEDGDKISIDKIFERKDLELKDSFLYSLQRLSGKPEATTTLSPQLAQLQATIQLLSATRAQSKSDRLVVAQAIHYESKHSAAGYSLLENFIGDDKLSKELWHQVVTLKQRYTAKSIRYMASKDSEESFSTLQIEELRTLMRKAISPTGSDMHVAQILKILYGHLFMTSSIGKWYVYEDTHWKEDGDKEMRDLMRDKLIPLFEAFCDSISVEGGSKAEIARNKDAKDKCISLIKKLGSPSKKSILTEAEDIFLDTKIDDYLDGPISFYTFAFADCVYDLKLKVFTDGKPEDYCLRHSSISMKDNYYHMDHPDVLKVINFFKQNHANNEDLVWWRIDRYACCLEGGNRFKQITLNEGPKANNGKSTEEHMVKQGFGEYAGTAPTALLVSKRTEANGPTPAYKHIQGKRVVFVQEVTGRERLNAGVLKEISSGIDPIPTRSMGKDKMIEVIPTYKIFLVCNKAPKVDPGEVGVFLRARLTSYDTIYVPEDEAPETEEEQWEKMVFPIDPDMIEINIPRMLAPFMWLLIQRYNIWSKTGPPEPKIVKQELAKFKLRNDTYGKFIMKNIEEDEDSYLNLDDMYDNFGVWFKKEHPGAHQPSQDELGEYMRLKYPDQEEFTDSWKGLRLKLGIKKKAVGGGGRERTQ